MGGEEARVQMVAAQAAAPQRPPVNIEDFLWNVHSTLVATPGPLGLEHLKDAYSKHLGHKCAIERFLVVGEGGLAATLKRIPHIVTVFMEGGATCVRATQPADINKAQLIEADQQYRRELIKKNAAAKAKMAAGGAGPKAVAAAPPKAPAAAGGAADVAKAASPPPAADGQAKRPADAQAAAGAADAKRPRADSDADTLARMLVQGVVRVLQNRAKANKGPLPLSELEEEFKALWKVPFNLQQAGETDTVTFLQKWPNKVELQHDGTQHLVQLPKKGQEKAKAGEPPAAVKAGAGAPAAASAAAAPGGAKAAPPKPAAPAGTPAAAKPPPAKAPVVAAGTAAKSPAVPGIGAKAPPAAAVGAGAAAAKPAAEVAASAKNGPIPKRPAGGPSRPPSSIEEFLFNIFSTIDAYGGPMPLDKLKDAYSQHLGHKCAIERFLVVGEGGLAATLKRIPHVVVVSTDKDGVSTLKAALPSGTTKEQLIAADNQYRRQLQQKNAAAKAAGGAAAASPPVAAAKAPAAAAAGAAPAAGEKRPADAAAAGERAAQRPRQEDADTLARMLVQGIVRVLQNRQKDGKGPLPVGNLEEEFKALWKVPFSLAQAGETDVVTFLQKWPNKVDVVSDGAEGHVVQLAKKAAEKAKAAAPAADGEAAAPAVPAKTGAAAPAKAGPPAKAAGAASVAAVAKDGAPSTSSSQQVARDDEQAAASAGDMEELANADDEAAAEAAVGEAGLQTLPEIRQEAEIVLQTMQEMLRKQEALVGALRRLEVGAGANPA